MPRAPILMAVLFASGLGLTGLAVSDPGDGIGEVGQGAVVIEAPRPESGRPPSPAPFFRPATRLPPPDRASVPPGASDAARRAAEDVTALLERIDDLAAENARLRAALDAARARQARHAAQRAHGLAEAIDGWIADELRPDETRVTLGDGRVLDLAPDVADVLGSVARWARVDDLDRLRRHVDAGRLHDVADVLAWWCAESAATGRQDWDERERRLEAVLGLPVWNPPPPGATIVAAR